MNSDDILPKRGRPRSEIPAETQQPFELNASMAEHITDLGIKGNIDQLQKEGYSIIADFATSEFITELKTVCLRLASETQGPGKGLAAAQLLGRDPIFEEIILHPKITAMTEVMCGKGALLTQMIASVRPTGAPPLKIHADQNWFPAPFPKHNQLFTFCLNTEVSTVDNGCTKVVPRSHLKFRHPNKTEIDTEDNIIPIECPIGYLPCWNGSVWHGSYPRIAAGARVVLHITFGRMSLRTVDNYDHLDEAWLENKPSALRVLLGREDFLGSSTIDRGSPDQTLATRTFTWGRT